MKALQDMRILIVGLGVIGGGYAAALTRKGYDVDCLTKEQTDIDYALRQGILTRGMTEPEPERMAAADLVICALYPSVFVRWIEEHQALLSPGTIITDVTGVKTNVVHRVQACLRPDLEFISAHPMAGRESSGVAYSSPDVFIGANYIVTPTDANTPDAIRLCKELGQVLGFGRISELTCEEHDRMIAFLSQLTHCIAVSLMNCTDLTGLERYTGDSFRDLTRIAKINEQMWSELFTSNKEALLHEMDAFINEFSDFRRLIAEDDTETMKQKMRTSTERRARFDKPKK